MLWLLLQACEIDKLPVLIRELQIKISYFGNILQKGLNKNYKSFLHIHIQAYISSWATAYTDWPKLPALIE